MSNTHTLIQHRDIQNWVSARKGAIIEIEKIGNLLGANY